MLFDGTCNLCNAGIRFAIDNDPARRLRFAALDSPAAHDELTRFGRTRAGIESIVLIDGDGMHERSDAALRIAALLRAPWPAARIFARIPRAFRDRVYDTLARQRYRLFGRRTVCPPPRPGDAGRFL